MDSRSRFAAKGKGGQTGRQDGTEKDDGNKKWIGKEKTTRK